ncbi:MAG: DinB family protein [Acidimicrobiales bacterium]|jgi:uncharacterized damage-inducible protein DinB
MTASWTAPAVDREEPALTAGERESLEQWLDYQRETLQMKCTGLTAAQLKARPVSPSGLSLLGLVRHMTEVERWWFRIHAAGEQIGFTYSDEVDSADFDDLDSADAESNLAAYRREIESARAAVKGKTLDDMAAGRSSDLAHRRNLRWIYVHMIEEYARHNGHADLIRECIDGVVGD